MSDDKTLGCQNETVCNLVKSSINQAKKSYGTYVEMSDIMRAQSNGEGDEVFNQKALDFARQDTEANFDFALRILDVTDADEVIRLQDEHTQHQNDEMAHRVKELQTLANASATTAAVAPVVESAETPEIAEAPVEISPEPVMSAEVEAPETSAASALAELAVEAEVPVEAALPEADSAPTTDSSGVLAGAAAAAAAVGAATIAPSLAGAGEADEESLADAVVEPAVTGEVDSETIAAEIAAQSAPAEEIIPMAEPEVVVTPVSDQPVGEAVIETAASDGDIEAEIDALTAKIHEAKSEVEQPGEADLDAAFDVPPTTSAIPEVVPAIPEVVIDQPIVDPAAVDLAATPVVEVQAEAPVGTVEEVPVVVEAPLEAANESLEQPAQVVVESETPQAIVEAPVMPANDAPVPADPSDDDLSARLDAVRAMLQGSEETAAEDSPLKDAG